MNDFILFGVFSTTSLPLLPYSGLFNRRLRVPRTMVFLHSVYIKSMRTNLHVLILEKKYAILNEVTIKKKKKKQKNASARCAYVGILFDSRYDISLGRSFTPLLFARNDKKKY